jgi:hypothetical protein
MFMGFGTVFSRLSRMFMSHLGVFFGFGVVFGLMVHSGQMMVLHGLVTVFGSFEMVWRRGVLGSHGHSPWWMFDG